MAFGLGNSLPFLKPVSDWVDPRRNALMGLSAGAFSGDMSKAMQYAMQGGSVDMQRHDAMLERQSAENERNATAEWLKQNYPQFANLPPAQGFDAAMKMMAQARSAGEAPANIQEWNAYSAMTPDQKAEYLRMKRATQYLDVGTGFVSPDPLNPGTVAGAPIVKDNFTPKYDEALGAGAGNADAETQTAFDSLNSKLPGLKSVVSELGDLAEKATYTTAGKLWDDVVRESGAMPTEGALARTKYMSMVDNQVLPLLRDTFGAAFTVQEGESLRATLGAPDKSPDEKKAVLEAFIEQKARDLEALGRRLPGAKRGAAAAGGNTTSSGVTWSVEP